MGGIDPPLFIKVLAIQKVQRERKRLRSLFLLVFYSFWIIGNSCGETILLWINIQIVYKMFKTCQVPIWSYLSEKKVWNSSPEWRHFPLIIEIQEACYLVNVNLVNYICFVIDCSFCWLNNHRLQYLYCIFTRLDHFGRNKWTPVPSSPPVWRDWLQWAVPWSGPCACSSFTPHYHPVHINHPDTSVRSQSWPCPNKLTTSVSGVCGCVCV